MKIRLIQVYGRETYEREIAYCLLVKHWNEQGQRKETSPDMQTMPLNTNTLDIPLL